MKKIFLLTLIIFPTSYPFLGFCEEKFLPIPLVHLDSLFSHHVLIAEKSTHKLYLFENKDSFPRLLKTYTMATGKKSGNKVFQGDHRTPEGVYHFTHFIPHNELIEKYGKDGEKYGIGSFVTNYPNIIDKRMKKNGSGIWLHSTNDETRIEKGLDSRGCVVIANNDLKDISKYIELSTTKIIIVEDLKYLPLAAWKRAKNKVISMVQQWLAAWQQENFSKYINFYHPKKFHDPIRGPLKSFSQYKNAVFKGPGRPEIEMKNLSIIKNGQYIIVTFKQVYRSNKINDIGIKTIYLQNDEFYHLKIVSERWTKANFIEEKMAFRPSMRFFTPEDQPQKSQN